MADKIEGYNENNVQNNLYDRQIVDVMVSGKDKPTKALVYYQSNVTKYALSQCDPVPNGDWLQRLKKK